MGGFWFNQIHFIQSLPIGQLRAATVLRTALLLEHPEAASRLLVHDVYDRQQLQEVLNSIEHSIEAQGLIPFIHIECHGSPTGLELASGEHVTWNDFRELFRPLNIACALNLFVSLAACHGDMLASSILLTEPAPVWGLLGPRSVSTAGDLAESFKNFFGTILTSNELRAALDAAGGGLPPEGRSLVLWTADFFFAHAFVRYLADYCKPRDVARRAKVLAAKIQQQNGWPKETRRDLARRVRHDLLDLEPHFQKFLRVYLMLDRYPQNEQRFPLNSARIRELYEQFRNGA